MKSIHFLSLIISTALQGVVINLLLSGSSLLWLMVAHISASILWGWGAAILFPHSDRKLCWLNILCALIFPVWGALASLFVIRVLSRPPPEHPGDDYVIWDEHIDSRWKEPAAQSASAQAVIEILQSPEPGNRRHAILSLRNLDPRLSIPLLRKGLLDSDEQVRIYSQNILANILDHFEKRIKVLAQTQKAEPDNSEFAVRLAEYYFELVYLDVAGDRDSDAHNLSKALSLLNHAYEIAPQSLHTCFLAMKYALRAADLPAAKKWLAILEAQKFDQNQLMPWRMEIAYRNRDWAQLRSLFSQYDHHAVINPRIGQLGRFWFGEPVNAA